MDQAIDMPPLPTCWKWVTGYKSTAVSSCYANQVMLSIQASTIYTMVICACDVTFGYHWDDNYINININALAEITQNHKQANSIYTCKLTYDAI